MGLISKKKSKPKAKKLSWYKKRAWTLFSEYIRRKDSDEGGFCKCFTCEKILHWKDLQAGHAIPGRHNAVLLDEEIVKPQCVGCNVLGRGMYHIFSTKLILEHGMDFWLGKLAGSKATVKMTRADYEEIAEELREKLLKLKESPA